MTSLKQDYDSLSKMGMISKEVPSYIVDNLNPNFELREYQKESIARFIFQVDLLIGDLVLANFAGSGTVYN